MTPEASLQIAKDKDSFIEFVAALADERERAGEMESANPDMYVVDGALNWKTASIPEFLYAALAYFDKRPFHEPESTPSWKMLAEFLHFGKIYE
jgi:hypothetical protein